MIVDVANTAVTLLWLSPDQPNGIITSYRVQYSFSDRDDYTSTDTMTNDLTYRVTGLMAGTEYNFRVRAETVVAGYRERGPHSNVVTTVVGKLECYTTNECIYIMTKAQTNSDFNIQMFF